MKNSRGRVRFLQAGLIAWLGLVFMPSIALAACEFSLSSNPAKVGWTAYKFTERAAVKGTFREVEVESQPGGSMEQLLKSVKFTIDGKSIESGDPSRNANISSQFFGAMKNQGKITGKVVKVKKGAKPEIQFELDHDGEKQIVALPYKTKGNLIIASGPIDLLNMGLKGPFDSLHSACKELHRGKDGVTKTWSTVDLSIEAEFKKDCT